MKKDISVADLREIAEKARLNAPKKSEELEAVRVRYAQERGRKFAEERIKYIPTTLKGVAEEGLREAEVLCLEHRLKLDEYVITVVNLVAEYCVGQGLTTNVIPRTRKDDEDDSDIYVTTVKVSF